MRVIHVAPTPFGADGLFGGGERYPLELARALARRRRRLRAGDLRAATARGADDAGVARSASSAPSPACGTSRAPAGAGLLARWPAPTSSTPTTCGARPSRRRGGRRRALPASGWSSPTTGSRRRLGRTVPAALRPVPHRVASTRPRPARRRPARTRVIYGGADPERFRPDGGDRRDGVLFVGRLTPHKGLDRLIAGACPDGASLTVAGHRRPRPAPPGARLPARSSAGWRRAATVRFAGPVVGRRAGRRSTARAAVSPAVGRRDLLRPPRRGLGAARAQP